MAKNAGESPDIICSQVLEAEDGYGYDFVDNKIVDMIEHGIIDPVKVTKTALKNAISVAASLLITNCAVIEK